jgi:4-hydroxy-tetrahydrodipicolinate synthase
MIKGVYSATCSILHDDCSLNVDATIAHAASSIKSGLHGVIFFGSTGQGQLIDLNSKKNLISKAANHKLRKQFFFGTGCNSLNDTINLIKYGMEYEFKTWLIMPPAYYSSNTEQGVYNFYKNIIRQIPKVKIILYNFEKLSSFLFKPEFIKQLVSEFPNIIGVKDSSYNLYENLKIPNFKIFIGSEAKLLKNLELGGAGTISAITGITHSLARQVFDDFENKQKQTQNEKLIALRETFDEYNLISALHSYFSVNDSKFKNLLPPLVLLPEEKKQELLAKLKKLDLIASKGKAA